MIYSMTGFATLSVELDTGSLSLELRAVNHRYLDLLIRMPEELRSMETLLREKISAQLTRGKVECRIGFTARQAGQNPAQLNQPLILQLAQWNKDVLEIFPQAQGLSVSEVLHWNGVLQSATVSADTLRTTILETMQKVLDEFAGARKREGEKMQDFLLQRVAKIEKLCGVVVPFIPAAVAAYEEKLASRLRAAMLEAVDDRLHQEIALFASKIDVDEELSRLRTHLAEIKRVLAQGGTVGKRLDFLMQELHREANTLGSKSVDAEVSRASMEMKLLIEQMREQIQNIE
jgi:uncharacterized protein (TIGR00255 family)